MGERQPIKAMQQKGDVHSQRVKRLAAIPELWASMGLFAWFVIFRD